MFNCIFTHICQLMNNPKISICIPAYKHAEYLRVLLLSVKEQTYTNFEVVVSDDSPADEVELLCTEFADAFQLRYFRNKPAKGSPGNWNFAIAQAKGAWIKIMHDDDWFAGPDSLAIFAEATENCGDAGFIFSGYANVEKGKAAEPHIISAKDLRQLKRNPLHLFTGNHIGNPCTTLVKNDQAFWYDENLKWVVDFEFYLHALKTNSIYSIPQVLINVGIHSGQITKEVFRNRSVEIPENLYMLNKLGADVLGNVWVFDYYWRLFRNLDIRFFEEIYEHVPETALPKRIQEMLQFQLMLPLGLLRIGLFSKTCMYVCYLATK